jgi:group I intron endonuclease
MLQESKNGQSASKPLSSREYEEGSTTIPQGSTGEKYPWETPDSVIYKFDIKEIPKNLGSGVYCIRNMKNNKYYIGSCLDFRNRASRHLSYLNRKAHHSLKLQNSFNKNGQAVFMFIILSKTTEPHKEEQRFLDDYKPYINGYNISPSAKPFKSFTQKKASSQKASFSKSLKIVQLNLMGEYLRTHDSVSKAAVFVCTSSSNISRCCKKEFVYIKDSLWIYESEYDSSVNYCYNPKKRVFSEAHKKAIGKSLLGRKQSKAWRDKIVLRHGKKVSIITQQGDILETYVAIREAARCNAVCMSSIRRSIENGKPCKGKIYKYTKDIV